MLELTLVRHGHPLWEPDGHAVDEPDLSDLGREQASRLAEAWKGRHYDHFYVSPLARARQTAAPLAALLGMEPEVLSWLAEYRTPPLEGTPSEQVRAFLANVRARPLEEWWEGVPGGESFRHFQERIEGGLEPLLTDGHRARVHPHGPWRTWSTPADPQRILMVAHGGTISVIISHLLGIEPVPWAWERFPLTWAAYAVLRTVRLGEAGIWALVRFNEMTHLEGLGRPAH